MRVVMTTSTLRCGGAEHSLATLASQWAEQGWEVTVLLAAPASEKNFVTLSPKVVVQALGFLDDDEPYHGLKRLLFIARGFWRFRHAIKTIQPDVVISFLDWCNVLTLMACCRLGIPVIISERILPQFAPSTRLARLMRWLTYRYASAVVSVTEQAFAELPYIKHSRRFAIPGPIDPPLVQRNPAIASKGRIIAAGRLAPQKGFDLLITALQRIKDLDWQLTIWGEGPMRETLKELVVKFELGNRVSLPGVTDNLYEHLCDSDLFVLSSRFEGYPRVLAEAMMCGLPSVSFDCPGAVSEMIENRINGVLVPVGNTLKLSEAIAEVLQDQRLRLRLSNSAPRIAESCSTAVTTKKWEEVLALFSKI